MCFSRGTHVEQLLERRKSVVREHLQQKGVQQGLSPGAYTSMRTVRMTDLECCLEVLEEAGL